MPDWLLSIDLATFFRLPNHTVPVLVHEGTSYYIHTYIILQNKTRFNACVFNNLDHVFVRTSIKTLYVYALCITTCTLSFYTAETGSGPFDIHTIRITSPVSASTRVQLCLDLPVRVKAQVHSC